MHIMEFIMAAVLMFSVLYQIAIGGIVTRSWKPWLYRRDDPRAFWFLIVLQSLVSVTFIAVMFFLSK